MSSLLGLMIRSYRGPHLFRPNEGNRMHRLQLDSTFKFRAAGFPSMSKSSVIIWDPLQILGVYEGQCESLYIEKKRCCAQGLLDVW